MRFRYLVPLTALSFSVAAAPFYNTSSDRLRQESGKIAVQENQGKPVFLLSGTTALNVGPAAQYRSGAIEFAKPLDLTGKQIRFRARSATPDKILALYVRAYNEGQRKPVWSALNYASPFSRGEVECILVPEGGRTLVWEPKVVSGEPANKVKTIQFLLGSRTENAPIAAEFYDFVVEPAAKNPSRAAAPKNAPLTTEQAVAAIYHAENLSCANGKFTVIEVNGQKAIRLSGTTRQQKSTNYFVGRIRLPGELNLDGKQLQFTVSTTTPAPIVALVSRYYNAGNTAKPVWSFMQWGGPFSTQSQLRVVTAKDHGQPLAWEADKVSGATAGKVNLLEFWIGSTTPDVPVEITLADFTITKAEPPKGALGTWKAVPDYAATPAKVKQPAGSFKEAELKRARENLKKYEWAREAFAPLRERGEYWMQFDRKGIETMIPLEDAWFKCLCPNCGTQPEFAWAGGDVLQPDLKSIRCTKCKMVFPNDQYPENRTYTVKMPNGTVKTIKYYHGKDQLAQGENYGPRYHLSGAVNYVKLRNLPAIYSTALLYAIEGNRKYAEKVRDVLVRFAQAYPGYSCKFRATAYEDARKNSMAGKMCAWKFHDSSMLPAVLNAYCLTYNSGVYSDADKVAIENGICREYKALITAYPPTKDWCLNAVPAHMTTAALCAAITGDHDLMDWVLQGPDGFIAFIDKYYTRDGHWYESAPSYANMANDPIIALALALQGYSDAPEYQGKDRYDNLDIFKLAPGLELVLSGMSMGTLPTGNLPAFNDSAFNARQSQGQLEIVGAFRPTPENRQLVGYFAQNFPGKWGREYSLLLRDPGLDLSQTVPPPADLQKPLLFPGGGWALLRRPENATRDAAALHFGGDIGGHSHNSTLSFLYCVDGKEVVSDLGYLSWWHDHRTWNNSTLAHNLVVVDGKEQQKTRFGTPELFAANGSIAAARFDAANAYPGTTERYARTLYVIPTGKDTQYIVDLFDVRGGKNHLWAFHADGNQFTAPAGVNLKPRDAKAAPLGTKDTGAEWLKEIQEADVQPGAYTGNWKYDDRLTTRLTLLAERPLKLMTANAPGLRDQKTPYLKVPLHLMLAQAAGPESRFVAILETAPNGQAKVRQAALEPTKDGSLAVKVDTADGFDRITVAADGKSSAIERFDRDGKRRLLWQEGKSLLRGKILTIDPARKELVTDLAALPAGYDFKDLILAVPAAKDGAYRLAGAEMRGGKAVFRLHAKEILRLKAGESFVINPYAEKKF